MTATPDAITDADIDEFARTYARPGGWRGAAGLYRSMLQEGPEIKALAESPGLNVPVLAVGAGGGPFTARTMAQAASGEISSVQLDGTGHYVAMEAPEKLAGAILGFVDGIDALLIRVLSETAEEAPEQPALPHQRRGGRRCLREFPADGLFIVGSRDGVHDLRLVECLGAGNLRDEADQVPVEQHLGLKGRRAFVTPDRLAPAAEHDTYSVDIDPRSFQVCVNAAISESVGDAAGPVLIHAVNLQPAATQLGHDR
jgi:hypothetical protein